MTCNHFITEHLQCLKAANNRSHAVFKKIVEVRKVFIRDALAASNRRHRQLTLEFFGGLSLELRP